MNYYIFDREKDNLLRDEDNEKIFFKSNEDVWDYLRNECQFSQDWIDKNFFIMKGIKILEPEHGVSNITCDLCNHKWIAVAPTSCEKLECPNCNNFININ